LGYKAGMNEFEIVRSGSLQANEMVRRTISNDERPERERRAGRQEA
jgi:hypothetical protein